MGLGYAGDSFNDVISKLLRIQRSYQEKQEQLQRQQQERNDENSDSRTELFPANLSELFNEQDSQQLADLLGGFVRQLPRTNSKQCRSSLTIKRWTGWDLNPRPQQCHWIKRFQRYSEPHFLLYFHY
jgi:hypothetical protein